MSAQTENAFAMYSRTGDDKLGGWSVNRFGGFLKRSWRVNDWTWGRLDAATALCRTVLDPERVRRTALLAGYLRDGDDPAVLADETLRGITTTLLPGDPLAGIRERSHGEGIMDVLTRRVGPGTLLLLDEPEDGLSIFTQLELLGLLTVLAAEELVEQLWARAEADPTAELTVDLETRELRFDDRVVPFELDDFTRWRLLNGLDDIGLTLRHTDAVAEYETRRPAFLPTTLPLRPAGATGAPRLP